MNPTRQTYTPYNDVLRQIYIVGDILLIVSKNVYNCETYH